MTIGVLREPETEKRVVLTPDSVKQLINLKVKVMVENHAGVNATFEDAEYILAGAETLTKEQLLKKSDIIVKINPVSIDELRFISPPQVVIASMNPFFDKTVIKFLVEKKITSFSMELLPRITKSQSMDVLTSMASVSGYKAVLHAAMLLPKFFPMFISAAGTIKPARVLILGAGVAGLYAVAIARKLGAVVEVFDVRAAVKEEVVSLGGKFIEVEGASEDPAAGGYAVEQGDEFKTRQADLIHTHALAADVIICTAQIPGKKAPVLLKKATVSGMRNGSVIIDLASSTGGNCELTKDGIITYFKGKTIVGNSAYPSEMPLDASSMYSKNMFNFLKLMIRDGKLNIDFGEEIIRSSCLTHQGEVISKKVQSIQIK